MDIAEAQVLAKGFDATSIDELIAEAEITKSGFFYHFKDKSELGRALLVRFIERDHDIQEEIFRRARELNEDPLQAFLVGLKLFAEMAADLPNGHPGCLVAIYTYQERLFDREIRELNRQAVLKWRERFLGMLEEIAARYPPREKVDLQALADMVNTIMEGGIVMSKAVKEPKVLEQQIMLLRSYVRLLFS